MDYIKKIKNKILHLSDRYCFYEKEYYTLNKELLTEKNRQKKLNKQNKELLTKVAQQKNKNRQSLEKLKDENRTIKKELTLLESILDNINLSNIPKKYCPICKHKFTAFLPFGENLRKNAQCPFCKALERHRTIYLYLSNKTKIFKDKIKLLHFAPEPIFANIFSKCKNIDYLPVDLFPGPHVKEQFDIQNIPYPENSFDVIYCSHVLEHVPDDKKALKELLRVIKPRFDGGFVLLQVPINPSLTKTLEKEEYNTPELRAQYYGQSDHLRYYGTDFSQRVEKEGFTVKNYQTKELLPNKEYLFKYGLIETEKIYVCTK